MFGSSFQRILIHSKCLNFETCLGLAKGIPKEHSSLLLGEGGEGEGGAGPYSETFLGG